MFKPVKGPKEGRSPPGLLYSGSQYGPSRRFSNRQLTLGLLVTLCFVMGYFIFNTDAGTISDTSTLVSAARRQGSSALENAILGDQKKAPAADVYPPEIHAEVPPPSAPEALIPPSVPQGAPKVVAPGAPKPVPHGTPQVVPQDTSDYQIHHDQYSEKKARPDPYAYKPVEKPFEKPLDEVYHRPAYQPSADDINKAKQEAQADDGSTKHSAPQGWRSNGHQKAATIDPAPARETWAARAQFEKSLDNVIALLPDEVHMRELIRPVDGSGKERMREMGLRTRAYRKYFEAWEALHLTTDSEGATYVRDDVIQYLRSHEHISKDADFSEDSGIDGVAVAQSVHSYEAYRAFIQKFANLLFPWTAPWFSDHMSLHAHFKKGGRGIVLTAGDDQAPYLLTTIYSFRQLGCTLPIEVMYLGDQDLGEDYRAELEALPGVICRDIAQMTNDAGWKLAGWAAKPFAILLSSFREVIFIDADSLFFKNPEILFEEPDYVRTGALFFRDRMIMPESKKRWLQQVLPKPIPKLAKQSRFWTGESGHMQESGVVVMDKWKHFISMMLVTRFNGPDRDGNKEKGITGVYDMMYGDKETFWIGFLLAGDEEYAFHQGDAGIMGELDVKEEKELKKRDLVDDLIKEGYTKEVTDDEEADEEDRKVVEQAKKDAEKETEDEKKDEDKEEDKKDEEKKEETKKTEAVTTTKTAAVAAATALNHTICAPQLLHLDLDGKPLWFNGWLLHNKFAEKSKKRFARFEHYLIEPRDVREPGAWQLAKANMCCLTTDADRTFPFSEEDKKTLNMIMRRAEDMGMGNQS